MDNRDRTQRLNDAIKHLISVGLINGKSTTKSIAQTLNRNSTNISSALRGDVRYLNRKFIRDFCATYKNIIYEDWIWDGTGDMLNKETQVLMHRHKEELSSGGTPFGRLLVLKEWLQTNDPKCKNNESEVLRRLGLGVGYFGTSEKQENKSLRESTYKKIGEAWPAVNIEWLRTGNGEMFTEPVVIETESVQGAPYYDVDFIGGFNEMTNGKTVVPAYYIDFLPYNKKGNMWCNIVGDSMSPRINSGDKICIQPVNSIEDIIFGEIYAIVTVNDMRTVKWVTRSPESGMIRLIPENKDPRYGDYQDIPKTDIRHIYKVVGAIRSL